MECMFSRVEGSWPCWRIRYSVSTKKEKKNSLVSVRKTMHTDLGSCYPWSLANFPRQEGSWGTACTVNWRKKGGKGIRV